MRDSRFTAAAAGILIAGLGLLGSWAAPAWSQSLTPVTLVIPNPSAINVFPVHVAIGEGYFEEEGLDVTVEAVDGSAQVLQAMSADQADIGEPGPGPVLAARARGVDVVFIYNLNPTSVFGIVVKEESEHDSVDDLKGQTIGVGTADGAEVAFARAILSDAGMTEGEDYTFLPVGDGGLATAAFLRGDIEAYAAATSDAAILNSRGMAVRDITPEEFKSYFGNGFAVMRDYLEANPEVIKGFGRAIVRGTQFGQDPANLDKVLEHTTAGNPQEGEDKEFAAALLEAIKQRGQPTDPSKGWGYQPPEHWETWHQSLLDSGALQAPLDDLEAAYTNEFVDEWNSAAGQ